MGRSRGYQSLAVSVFAAQPVYSNQVLENTALLDVSMGSRRSQIAKSLSRGGYELSNGTEISFKDWYRPNILDLNVKFLTTINDSFGVVWGFSSGEKGEKYQIDPGMWFGFIHQSQLSNNSSLTFSAITLFGGDFREQSCKADYGAIGGVQKVNCRLAASTLPPVETLEYLVDESGFEETHFSVRYQLGF